MLPYLFNAFYVAYFLACLEHRIPRIWSFESRGIAHPISQIHLSGDHEIILKTCTGLLALDTRNTEHGFAHVNRQLPLPSANTTENIKIKLGKHAHRIIYENDDCIVAVDHLHEKLFLFSHDGKILVASKGFSSGSIELDTLCFIEKRYMAGICKCVNDNIAAPGKYYPAKYEFFVLDLKERRPLFRYRLIQLEDDSASFQIVPIPKHFKFAIVASVAPELDDDEKESILFLF